MMAWQVQFAEPKVTDVFGEHSANVAHFACADSDAKALATLRARFALAGHCVHVGSDSDFIVTLWPMTRYCRNFTALRAFARQVGIKA